MNEVEPQIRLLAETDSLDELTAHEQWKHVTYRSVILSKVLSLSRGSTGR